MVISKSRSRGS